MCRSENVSVSRHPHNFLPEIRHYFLIHLLKFILFRLSKPNFISVEDFVMQLNGGQPSSELAVKYVPVFQQVRGESRYF
jgi:hypothetical protein